MLVFLLNFGMKTKWNFQHSSNDDGIKYYCAGYVARSLAKNQKCEHCRQLLIGDINPPNITLTEDENIEEDLKQ